MARNSFAEWSKIASDNTDIGGINIAEGCAPSGINNAIRTMMAQLSGGAENGAVYAAKSGNYTSVVADENAYLRFTAPATLSLTAASTLGANWHVFVHAAGGSVIIDPNASETINGATTITLASGQACFIICTGTAFFAFTYAGLAAENIWSAKQTYSNVVEHGNGINFGTAIAPGGPSDLSRHINLVSGQYGFSVTAATLNYVSGATHTWISNGTTVMNLTAAGSLSLATALAVSYGGTGSTTVAGAQANLGINSGLIGLLTSDLAAGALGSYVFAARRRGGTGEVSFGDTISGANLDTGSTANNAFGSTLSGTYLCLGYLGAGSTASSTLFRRI
jgi:predicted small integral membrane protein